MSVAAALGRAAGGAFAGPVRHVYVHVPFCRARCDYCDFASEAVGDEPDGRVLDRYVDCVGAEWERERAAHDVRRLETLYLGGGTPSLLGPQRLERLLEPVRPLLTRRAEVTVEANPEDVDASFAAWAGDAGVRISLGVQSFSPELRDVLGRRAQAEPARAFGALRDAGVRSLSLDLIHGIPGQTAALLGDDIAAVVALHPEHVSWYELDLIEGTRLVSRLGASPPDGPAIDPNDDARAAGYRRIVRALARAGYSWYEVSNFARPKQRARHNMAYWRARPYLGLGPGAVSTVGARRWKDSPAFEPWLAALEDGSVPPRDVESLDDVTRARERLLLAARCGLPVPLADVSAAVDLTAAAALAAAGLVSLHSGTIRVTRKGRYVANEVCVRLFRDTRLRG